jgi:hypothetical protein
MGVEERRALTLQEISDLGAGLDAASDTYRANPAGGHVWHLSLSLPADDRQLSDDQWAQIAQRAVEAIGFEREGMEPAAWVAVAHGKSAMGNAHIHIAGSLVRVDGSRVDTWQSKRVLLRVCAELEADYGSVVVEGREGRGMPGLSRAELERTTREQLAEPPRITLARIAREASVASKDEAEFVRRLRGSGALARPRFETGGQHEVVGYSVAVRTTEGTAPIWFGRGEVGQGPDLAAPAPVLGSVKRRSKGSCRRMERCQVGCPRKGGSTGGGRCREVYRAIESRSGVRSRRVAWGGSRSRRGVRRLAETPGGEQSWTSGGNSTRTGSISAEPTG